MQICMKYRYNVHQNVHVIGKITKHWFGVFSILKTKNCVYNACHLSVFELLYEEICSAMIPCTFLSINSYLIIYIYLYTYFETKILWYFFISWKWNVWFTKSITKNWNSQIVFHTRLQWLCVLDSINILVAVIER